MTENIDQKQDEKFVQEKIDDLVPLEKEGTVLVRENIENKINEDTKLQDEDITKQKQKLDEAQQSVSKQTSKKSRILNVVFFIVNLAVVAGILFYQFMNEKITPVADLRFDVTSLLLLVVILTAVILCDTFAMSYLLKQSTGKWKFGTAYKVANIGKYYDCVTPMSTGGQPFQVTYLKSHGIPMHTSLSIPLAKYVFGQIAWVVISFICLVISWTDKSYGTFVSITSIIGFILGSFMLFITLFLCVCKTVGRKIVVKVLKILHKMKIIKNYDKQYEKITKYISDFQDVMKQYTSSPRDFIVMLFSSLLKNFLIYSMPFFVVRLFLPSLGGEMFFKLFVMSCLVDLSSSFFPLPGGTGMNEISFSAAFASVVNIPSILAWVLIIWRVCTYYFYLFQGVCILSYEFAIGNRKYKWEVRRENLAKESEVFKQEQINKFRAERAKRRKNKNKSGIKEYL